ncbi:CBS domain-containing protein [Tianweitania populi]|uniref:Inosine-5-monophosphate dehydrogenase n=1 Tax=Tianweitania populi TaxID=1607949 RepID=A0A8J3DTE9_9HYPH|nr:CBS domain-containing protein [Tianweitania populi]GHD08461.1 inosine-5-monophosphate dehydrogenase [Tianweitania populi]
MTVRKILETKGRAVATIGPDQTLADAAKSLGEQRIGALVVTDGDGRIAGILSERDIVRVVGRDGALALEQRVSAVMTSDVTTCSENQTASELLEIMTNGRFRHLPVERDGQLDGIISIGDVVKLRIEDVERESEEIKLYIATA